MVSRLKGDCALAPSAMGVAATGDPVNAHRAGEITGRELPAKTPAVVTVGRFQAGQAPNIIPDEAVLEGTVRTFDRAVTARLSRYHPTALGRREKRLRLMSR